MEKEGLRYRQLAGSYIELRSGAYLSASPSNLSPRFSPVFSFVHPPPFSVPRSLPATIPCYLIERQRFRDTSTTATDVTLFVRFG